jgi:hypothetical protein
MEQTGVDRRPGVQAPVKKPARTSRFAHLARSGERSLPTSSSMVAATFVALTLIYGYDDYFFGGHYASTLFSLLQQIRAAFGF